MIDLQINDIPLRIINVYAPNKDNPLFFQKINELVEECNESYVVVCGDLNLTLNPSMDSYNYVNINNPQSRRQLLDLMETHNLVDAFRYFYPDIKRYTWRSRNPVKQARLDYFIVSKHLTDLLQSCTIKPSYRSDHSAIEIKLVLDKFEKGKGIWRFNCGLLKDTEYLKTINHLIGEVKMEMLFQFIIYKTYTTLMTQMCSLLFQTVTFWKSYLCGSGVRLLNLHQL